MFIDPATGQPLPFENARRSGLVGGRAGHGRHLGQGGAALRPASPSRDDLKPAISVAERGFTVDQTFQPAGDRSSLADLQTSRASRKLFLTPPVSRCRSAAR